MLKIVVLLIIAASVAFGVAVFVAHPPDRWAYFDELIADMNSGRYDAIYDRSDRFLRESMTREEFAVKMAGMLEKMKRADARLAFVRSTDSERTEAILKRDEPDQPRYIFSATSYLGSGDREVSIMATWRLRWFSNKFCGLSLISVDSKNKDLNADVFH